MNKITYLKQKYTIPPKGDCQRSVMACLLNYDSVEKVPNFAESKSFWGSFGDWLDENNLQYIEIDLKATSKAIFLPLGHCGIVGKSPRGDYLHIVVGEIVKSEKGYEIFYRHDTSPLHDGKYLDDMQKLAFLSKKI